MAYNPRHQNALPGIYSEPRELDLYALAKKELI